MIKWENCNPDFYQNPDVVSIARSMLGMKLCSNVNGNKSSGIIIETEAYAGASDRASHAFGNRFTRRTSTMFEAGGIVYIYLCYGIHALLNIVTNVWGIPHAVLIRGILPLDGIDTMKQRVERSAILVNDGFGPGKVTRLLGLTTAHNGISINSDSAVSLYCSNFRFDDSDVDITPRIGVGYAAEDALLPYRFVVKPAKAASKAKEAGII